MFEKFTDRSRRVMQLSTRFAMSVQHEYVGTEHILVGLAEEQSGVASNVLKTFFPPGKIKETVLKHISRGPDIVAVERLPLTPRSKQAIEYAMEEARNLGHAFIGTEHLFLGLMRDTGHVASQVLLTCEKPLESIRESVLCILAVNPPRQEQQPLALDVSLEKARALHRVWRALNDGDCPKCHSFTSAHNMVRDVFAIECPSCGFHVSREEIEAIEKMFAPAMDAATAIFESWRRERGAR